jgi:hypothetical protein
MSYFEEVDARLIDENGDAYGVKHIDNKPRVSSTPYLYDIAEGKIPAHTPVYKFGNNETIGTTQESIWEESSLYPWDAIDAAPGIVTVSSTSAQDTLTTGTGAWTIMIHGLDSVTGLDISETINLTGQTAANSTLSYSRIFRAMCQSAGTGLANAGIIRIGTGTVTAGVPAVVWGHVAVGENQTLQCVWTVPTGFTFYMTQASFSVNGNKGGDGRIYARPPGLLFQIKDVFHLSGGGSPHTYTLPRPFIAGTDIDFRAAAGVAGTDVAANFEGWYE